MVAPHVWSKLPGELYMDGYGILHCTKFPVGISKEPLECFVTKKELYLSI